MPQANSDIARPEVTSRISTEELPARRQEHAPQYRTVGQRIFNLPDDLSDWIGREHQCAADLGIFLRPADRLTDEFKSNPSDVVIKRCIVPQRPTWQSQTAHGRKGEGISLSDIPVLWFQGYVPSILITEHLNHLLVAIRHKYRPFP